MTTNASVHTEKSSMDKINESMEKIGAMLGVQASASNASSDDKKEALIKKEEKVEVKKETTVKKSVNKDPTVDEELLKVVNSAEGLVVGPPTLAGKSTDGGESLNTRMTRPTTPGKTKTAVGGAVANMAAGIDNAMNGFQKSAKNLAMKMIGEDEETANGTAYETPEKAAARARRWPRWVYVSLWSALAVLVILGVAAAIPSTSIHKWLTDVHDDTVAMGDNNSTVAFIGNSYMYINDLPRVMEAISKHKIQEQSVINTGAGLGSLLKQGNGMYELWQTKNALDFWGTFDFKELMENTDVNIDDDYELYDFGFCTVPQLLEGYDAYLSYKNQNGVYFDVGTNPCFEDEYYMTIIQQASFQDPMYFDFVVLNDQTRRMANEDAREDSVEALAQAYAPLIKASRGIPIIIDTHAFYFENDGVYGNETIGEDGNQVFIGDNVAAFTAGIYEGLYEYVDTLKENLPSKQAPRIARVGLAYLAIYEDNYKMWQKLFADDGIHASKLGTYLTACVLYATMYGHLPPATHSKYESRSVFFRSRATFGSSSEPTMSDVTYLRKWAHKIVLENYKPKTMVFPDTEVKQTSKPAYWNADKYIQRDDDDMFMEEYNMDEMEQLNDEDGQQR